MLRATAVELFLTVTDIEEALESYAAGDLQELRVDLENGAVLLRHKIVIDKIPMGVPVELRFDVRAVLGTAVELGVTWTNMGLVPGFLKEIALQKAFEQLPGHYEEGRYLIDLAEVLDHVPVAFTLKAVQVRRDGIRVELADVIAFPIETQGLVAVPEAGALVPIPSKEKAQIPEHQSFYESLRAKVARWSEEKAPQWAKPLIPWLLAVPDFFVLMVRLFADPRIDATAKVVAGVTIAYFVSPVDLIPDPIPIIGEIDDLALALFALDLIGKRIPAQVIQEAWPGEGDVMALVQTGIDLVTKVLPAKVLTALNRLLEKR